MPFPGMLHSPSSFEVSKPSLAGISRACTGYVNDPGELRSLSFFLFSCCEAAHLMDRVSVHALARGWGSLACVEITGVFLVIGDTQSVIGFATANFCPFATGGPKRAWANFSASTSWRL